MKNKILLMIASMLGFATASDQTKYGPDMYGVRWPDVEASISGKVTDKEGNPIPDIEVRTSGNKTTTATDGNYVIASKVYGNRSTLWFVDVDGSANGGEFAEQNLSVELSEENRINESDNFAKSGVDVALKEKE